MYHQQPQQQPPPTPPPPQSAEPTAEPTAEPPTASPQATTQEASIGEQDMDLAGEDNEKFNFNTSPPGSYTKIIPRLSANNDTNTAAPPILPPHLMQVILNNPDKTNATILPQPNHVMLNHLYALSIKDGIMVLSATHRYRRKYVTTLLYKPI